MRNILVAHALSHRLRRTTIEFVMAFGRYAPPDVNVVYHNIRRPMGRYVQNGVFDALLLPYDLLSLRSSPQWPWVLETLAPLVTRARKIVAFPQDDYTYSRVLDDGLWELGVHTIYTPIQSGLNLIYPRMSTRADIRHALTGYVDEPTARDFKSKRVPIGDRPIDVGQRVRMLPPWFGRKGRDKGVFADLFASKAAKTQLKVDISTRVEDTLSGNHWYRFLASCRATIGQRGGASLCDPDGSIMRAVLDYVTEHPSAEFDEIEAACFPGLDGVTIMSAISPRLFDAAICGTAQILVHDDYLGVLEPWVHYIPTDLELSNFDELVKVISDHQKLAQVAEAAEAVLLEEGLFTYRSFVADVLANSIPETGTELVTAPGVDVAEELQWRLSAVAFEGVQRLSYLAWATKSVSPLARIAEEIESLFAEEPYLALYLDQRLLEALAGRIHLPPALSAVLGPTIDLLVETYQAGAIRPLIKWFRYLENARISAWELVDWVDRERVELDARAI